MLSEKSIDALEDLTKRYQKYGITFEELRELVLSRPNEISEAMAIVGIKFALSEEYGTCEWESFDTACEILGMTPDELQKKLQEIDATVITDVRFDTSAL